MTQKTLKLNDDWDLFVDTKGDLSVTDKTSKKRAGWTINPALFFVSFLMIRMCLPVHL